MARPAIGAEVGELRFKDIRYLPRTLRDFGDREAYVLVFANRTCPLAQRSWPKLARLERDYRDRGVQFLAVNVGIEDSIPDIAQQAIDYGISASEVERYVVNPGQACSYMIGMLRILELRDQARRELGDKFSLPAFHDVVLKNGSVPLDVLGEIVQRWVAQQKAA